MRKIILTATALALLLAGRAFALGRGSGYYLASDNYVFRQPNADDSTPSSYDSFELGGTVSGGMVTDTSPNAGVELQREFNPISDTADIHIGLGGTAMPEGGTISIMSGDTAVIRMFVKNGELLLDTPEREIVLPPEDGFYGIKITADVKNAKYSLMLNGRYAATEVPFSAPAEYIDRMKAKTDDKETGSFEFKHFYIYADYVVNEWFIGTHKNVPEDWQKIGTGASVSSKNISVYADGYGLEIADGDYKAETGIGKSIAYESSGLLTEWLFYSDNSVKDFGAALSAAGTDIIRAGANRDEFGYWLGGKFNKLCELKPNIWYDAQIEINEGKAKIYLNKRLVADNIGISGQKADYVRFTIGKAATGYGYVDEIKVKQLNPLPEDYVTEPVIPKKNGDYILGMQSCSLWREGTHMGWDFVNGYPERTPYLGFYDEGSPEVADWEIKWLTEHGIDFQMYCWFRQGSMNMPVQRPAQSWALHDGYMESEYQDKLKFVLMWENNNATGVSGMEDWKENLVPYWIEWYFKNPGYLVIDNKPVMAMYWLPKLIQNFGSTEKVREAMDYLDYACRCEGFDGVYLLFQADTRNPDTQRQYKEAGADAIFSYSAQTPLPAGQKAQFEAQSAPGIIDAIASPGMGWDNTAWGINRRVGWNNKADQLEIMQWLRDEYMPKQSGFAKKMITVDNWNEFSEGHWYYPSGVAGFDYLDAIRETFTDSPEHTDSVPGENAMKRFQHLYVQDRKIPKHSISRMLDKEEEKKAEYKTLKLYDFDEAMSFDESEMIDNPRIEDGCLKGTSTGIDPKFFIHNVNLRAESIKEIKVRAKSRITAPSRFQIFFITDRDTNWDEKKSVHTTLDNTGEWIELTMSTAGRAGFEGTITDFRIDPAELTGEFEIDSIEIRGADGTGAALLIDGAEGSGWRGVIIKDGRMYAPAVEYAAGFGLSYSVTLDARYLEMLNDDTAWEARFEVGKDAFVVDGEAYFPLRYVADALGFEVVWDSVNGCANVITQTSDSAGEDIPDPVGEWNFDTAGSYGTISERNNVSNESVKNGVYSFTATTADPILICSTDIDADKIKYCNIRVRNKSQGTYFQVFYKTQSDTTLSEDKSAKVRLTAGDTEFKTYTIDMSSSAKWGGKITFLRIDPIDATGTMLIDYIRFSEAPLGEDEQTEDIGENIIAGGNLYDKSLKFSGDGIRAEYVTDDKYIGKYSLRLGKEKADAALYIPCEVKTETGYKLIFAAKGSGRLSAGFYSGGTKGAAQSVELTGDRWQKFELDFPAQQGECDGIYISPSQDGVYIDNIRLCG